MGADLDWILCCNVTFVRVSLHLEEVNQWFHGPEKNYPNNA